MNNQKAFKKLVINLRKGDQGSRGTEKASEMVEMLSNNWDQFRESFDAMPEDEQESMMEFFESLDENYSDVLFGEDSSAEDMARYILSREDEKQEKFCQAMDEALDQVLHEETVII